MYCSLVIFSASDNKQNTIVSSIVTIDFIVIFIAFIHSLVEQPIIGNPLS